MVPPDPVIAAVQQRRMALVLSLGAVEGSLEAKKFVDMVVPAPGQGCNADEAEQQMVLHRLGDCYTHMKAEFESSKHQADSHNHGKI